jgi:hypothetical protein
METLARIAIRGGPGRYAPVTTYGRVAAVTRPLLARTLALSKRVFAGASATRHGAVNDRHGQTDTGPHYLQAGLGSQTKRLVYLGVVRHIEQSGRCGVVRQERARAKLTELTQ